MDRIWSFIGLNIGLKTIGSAASSSQTAYERVANPQLKQINDSLYEVYAPEGRPPAVEIIFFHGLQFEGSRGGQFSTWLSRDGSQIWLNWIAEDIPDARILTVSYDAQHQFVMMDISRTAENLLMDLLADHIGQSGCPVVLVAHSLGGLVVKQLCVWADSRLYGVRYGERVQHFLNNLKGFFFYASPHYGSKIADLSRGSSKWALFEPITILNNDAAQLNEQFRTLRAHYKLRAFGFGESVPVQMGMCLMVDEASARLDVDEFYISSDDHFSVCRPDSKLSSSYYRLLGFVRDILEEAKAQRGPKLNFPKAPGPKTDFPDEVIGLERQTMTVIEKLDITQRLCLVGVQGIGKTTLVEAVYNKIKERFDYTCFLGEASKYLAFEEHPDDLRAKIKRSLCFGGLEGNVPNNFKWSTLQGRNVLIVLDDVVSDSQVLEITESDDFSDESRIIVTTKDAGCLNTKTLSCHSVEKLGQDDSLRLFCLHAFQMANVPREYENYKDLIIEITEYCRGLPQLLKMTGRYFHSKRKVGFEPETEIGMHEIGMHEIRMHEILQDLQRETKDSEGNTGDPRPENVSTQSKEFCHSVEPNRPYDQAPQDAEKAMARSREDSAKQIYQDEEDAGKSKVWTQEGSTNPVITEEDHDAIAKKGKFPAEEDAKKLNVTDKDCENNSIVGTPQNHEKQQDFVKDFIREINRGESGYFVSKVWLFSLEEHDKETVMSVLRRAGYVEFHRSRTSIIYRRKNPASQLEIRRLVDSEMFTVSSSENKLQLDIVRTEASPLGSPGSLRDKAKPVSTGSNEKLESFKTALKDTGPSCYFVSTQWLSTLSDHEVEDLNVALCKAGYSQIDKTSTATYFKRHNYVCNNPGSQNETPSTSRSILADRGRSSTSEGTEFSLPEKLLDFNLDETKATSKLQETQRRKANCECLPQHLTVFCAPSFQSAVVASTSSSQVVSKNYARQRVGDCHVTMPTTRSQPIMNTVVDRSIEIRTIDFDDKRKAYVKTYSLDVSVETSLGACLTSDLNDEKVRYEFLKIQGAAKMEESMKGETGLVLRALRTNVVAYITKAEQSEGPQYMPLISWLGPPEQLQLAAQKRRVGMDISAKNPKNSEPGSTTLELQHLDKDCVYSNHELFCDPGPRVVFEGDLRAYLNRKLNLELDVRYELEICHDEYCDSLPQDDHFVGVDRKIKNVDFDIVLEFSCEGVCRAHDKQV